MQSSKGHVVYRIGIFFLVMHFIIFTAAGIDQGLAAQPKTWKPNKPLTIIVSSYGGAFDLTARQLSRVLPDYLGQKVIVQGVLGAEGRNALDTLQRSKPDGHTFSLLGVGTYVASALKNPYSWNVKDMPVILTIETPPYGVFVYPKSPYLSYEDIVKMKQVLRIAVATANFALLPILVDFDKKGVQYKVARFKGSAESGLAVIAGNADLTSGALSGVNMNPIKAGDFRPLWVYDAKRFPALPNVPTHIELGMPKEWSNYRIVRVLQVAPGTPDYIQKALQQGLMRALRDKRTLEWSKKADTPVDLLSDKDSAERIRFLIKGFTENPKIVEAYF